MRGLVSDERLSRRLATGEAAGFDELYRRYAHRLAAYAASLLGDRAAGEDVAQVALLNAYQALRRGRVPDRVRPWLYRIAHNEAVDLLARRRELLHGVDADDRPAPEDPAATRGALLEALAKLPDRQRRAYLLREVHGLRVAEIAAELSLAVPQVEQALFAARNRLAEELVFPDGLTCDAARRLVEGPLASVERRALRRHFRTCERCRADGARVAPGLTLDWLRGRLADLLVGGAGPVAAKATAVVAAATVAGGAAVGPKMLADEPHPRVGSAVAAAATLPPPREVHPSPALAAVAQAPPVPVARTTPAEARDAAVDDRRAPEQPRTEERHDGAGEPTRRSRARQDDGRDEVAATATVAATLVVSLPEPTTTDDEGGDD